MVDDRRLKVLSSTMRWMCFLKSNIVLLGIGVILSQLVDGLALGEPPDGKAYLAAWTDGSAPYHDSPSAFNRRIGQNAYAFQLAQTIPITPYNYTTGSGGPINITLVTQTNTLAAIYLTVYPQSLERVTDQDLRILGQQVARYQIALPSRQVFLRFAPEMQGRWMTYGLQPTKFLALWKRMFEIIKGIAPQTIVVWAPNGAMGYPYGIQWSDISSEADQDLLDTNKNGQLDSNDDAYLPYYPGDAYVDWNGISWYWKGKEFPYRVNELLPSGYTAGAMTGKTPAGALGTGGTQTFTNFYDTYCQSKPCMFSEMGAAFHTNSTTATSQQSLQQAWWRDSLASRTFANDFPNIKMFMLFEHEKYEDGGDLRDYRISTNEQVRTAWLNDFQAVQSRFIWADNSTGRTNNPAGKGARADSTRLNRTLGWLISVAIGSTMLMLRVQSEGHHKPMINQLDKNRKRPEETSTSFYPGLANNASSNLCFLNSVIQALVSTSDLEDYLKQIKSTQQAGAEVGIIDSLLEIIDELNTPRDRKTVLRPTKFIECLQANHASSSRLFNSNQQDAHELLMMILEAVEEEVSRSARQRSSSSIGLAGLLNTHHPPPAFPPPPPSKPDRKLLRNPFRGLMANRIACAACGFSAGIRHSPTDHLSITLPVCPTCTLEDCLKEYTILELLDDYMCRKCTLLNREREIKKELEDCRSKRKRVELKTDLRLISEAIKVNPEQEFHPLLEHSLRPIWSPMSTKQTMFARPPRVLTVHVSRSTVMGEGHLMKNYCRLVFPELLILDRFTTTERLSARAEAPISRPTGASSDRTPSISYPYRLLAIVVHQGTHLSGHYLTFRRSPQGSWWRLSDQDVDRCPVREALDSNPTLLIYQRLGDEFQPQV